jgi:hypothetical protein
MSAAWEELDYIYKDNNSRTCRLCSRKYRQVGEPFDGHYDICRGCIPTTDAGMAALRANLAAEAAEITRRSLESIAESRKRRGLL